MQFSWPTHLKGDPNNYKCVCLDVTEGTYCGKDLIPWFTLSYSMMDVYNKKYLV